MLNGHPLFDRTVTVYRFTGDAVERQVIENCCFQWEDILHEDEIGEHMDRKCQLFVPGPTQRVFIGCRVLPGSGPEITPEQWPQFIPAMVDTLCEVTYVRPEYLHGQLSHVEAGRK